MSQRQLAAYLGLDVETCRVLDSGRREPSAPILGRLQRLLRERPAPVPVRSTRIVARREPPLPLPLLARLIGVHVRTLLAAAHAGYLAVTYDTRTTFRNLRRLSTLSAARHYKEVYYQRKRADPPRPETLSWSTIPNDYHRRIRDLRKTRRLTQAGLATRIGAAGKAVIYQWESRKRWPSPVFWSRIQQLSGR